MLPLTLFILLFFFIHRTPAGAGQRRSTAAKVFRSKEARPQTKGAGKQRTRSKEKGTYGGTHARQATGIEEDSGGHSMVVSASGGKPWMTRKSQSPDRDGNSGGGRSHMIMVIMVIIMITMIKTI